LFFEERFVLQILKSKDFARFCRKNRVSDGDLCRAIAEIVAGSADADLGGGVFKQRLRRRNEGKSGGFRTIILFRWKTLAIFVYGFAKNDRANITPAELAAWRTVSENLLTTRTAIEAATVAGKLIEVECDG
jgi:hypothetical protein